MFAHKLLLIGWDSADCRVMRSMMEAGRLPHLRALVEGGVTGSLDALHSLWWTDIVTGRSVSRNGCHDLAGSEPRASGEGKDASFSRDPKPVWSILSQEGKRSMVVGWRSSHPVKPLPQGVMVSDHYRRASSLDPAGPWPMPEGGVYPENLRRRLQRLRVHPGEISDKHIRSFVPGAGQIDPSKVFQLNGMARPIAECLSIHAVATHLIRNEPWDFMAVNYNEIGGFEEGFQGRHTPPEEFPSGKDFVLRRGIVEAAYRYRDLMLGVLIALAGEDTTILMVSGQECPDDHSLEPGPESKNPGIFALKGPGIRQGERIEGAIPLDICPTVLTLFGLPVGGDMDGRPLLAAWQKSPVVSRIPSWDDCPGPNEFRESPRCLGIDNTRNVTKQFEAMMLFGGRASEGHLQMGHAYLALKQFQAAEKAYRKALEEDTESAPARLGLAQVFLAGKQYFEAVGMALASIELISHQPLAHFILGVALQELGQAESAVEAFGRAIRQNPNFVAAHRRLAWVWKNALGNPDKAAQYRTAARCALDRLRTVRRAAGSGESKAQTRPRRVLRRERLIIHRPSRKGACPGTDFLTVRTEPPYSGASLILPMLNGWLPSGQIAAGVNAIWMSQSYETAFELMSRLLPFLPDSEEYRIVLMQRPLDEMVISRRKLLDSRGGKGRALASDELKAEYRQRFVAMSRAQAKAETPVLRLPHWRAIVYPRETARELAGFLAPQLDRGMVTAVTRELPRRRYE